MYLFADAHLGVNKRNKLLYSKSFEALEHIVSFITEQQKNAVIVNLGDLWDNVTPKPAEYSFMQYLIDKAGLDVSWYGIPGNHDMITADDACAWNVLSYKEKRIKSINEPTEIVIGKHMFYFVPYFVGMLDAINEYKGDAKILLSHFSTNQMNYFAGIVDESDAMFNKFDLIITGDTHTNYDSGKWHTCGSTYFSKVDEMVSPNSIPSVVFVDENAENIASTFKRHVFPTLKPKIISDEIEAVENTSIYVMFNDGISNKQNIIYKRLTESIEGDNTGNESMEESITHIGSVTFDSLINTSYSDMDESERNRLKRFCNRQIDIDELLNFSNTVSTVSKIEESVTDEVIEKPVNVVNANVVDISDLL